MKIIEFFKSGMKGEKNEYYPIPIFATITFILIFFVVSKFKVNVEWKLLYQIIISFAIFHFAMNSYVTYNEDDLCDKK